MSISISWRLVEPKKWKGLPGTSSEWTVFSEIFGRPLNYDDVEKLVAMHRATGLKETLWGELADLLNNLPEDSEIELKAEY